MDEKSITFSFKDCFIHELGENDNESENEEKYEARKNRLEVSKLDYIKNVLIPNLIDEDHGDGSSKIETLAFLLLLYEDLHVKGPWHYEKHIDYAEEISAQCEHYLGVRIEDLLVKRNFLYGHHSQRIFDECLLTLQMNLTANKYKRYPTLIEVYCALMEKLQDCQEIKVNLKTIPVSLLLIDDCDIEYKKKGIKACKNILKKLKPADFEGGNFYEVIYVTLKKAFVERDIDITKLVSDCLQELFRVTSEDLYFQTTASDELFTIVLEHIEMESSLYRKAALFRFLQFLIQMNEVNCVNRKLFQNVVSYNLDVCCHKGVDDIMLLPIVLCLEEWVKHCWCAWQLSSAPSILSVLMKVLITCKDDMVDRLAKITASFITLCSKEEKLKIMKSLEKTKCNEIVEARLNLVSQFIHVA